MVRKGILAQFAFVALAFIVSAPAYGQQTPTEDAARKAQLEKDVVDPTASLMSFNIFNIVTPNFYGIPGSANQIQFQPVIPFKAWGTTNILRVTMPFNTGGVPGRGLGDVTIFNLTVFPAKGGRWRIGPVMNLRNNLGGSNTDTFQIGLAVGYVGSKGKWTYGAFNQNLFPLFCIFECDSQRILLQGRTVNFADLSISRRLAPAV